MQSHDDRIVTIQLAEEESGEDVRLDDFLEQLKTLKSALQETERIVYGVQKPTLYFRIRRLEKNSPSRVTVEAVSDQNPSPSYASRVVRTLGFNLRVISRRNKIPPQMDFPAMESYRELTIPAKTRHLNVIIQTGKGSVTLNAEFRRKIETMIGKDEVSLGSISGRIEKINLHDRAREFTLYPIVGASRVKGVFPSKDRALFVDAVDKYVTVHGRLSYKPWERFPHLITADAIEIHNPNDRIGLQALRGLAPDATGILNSKDFIDEVHDEW